MSGESFPIDSVDRYLADLRSKLPREASVRDLMQSDSGELGPLAKVVIVYRVLHAHERLSAADMAAKLWEEMPEADRASIAQDRTSFIARIRRYFQPSQIPYATLTKDQARALEVAAAAIAERMLGRTGVGALLHRRWRSVRRLVGALMNDMSARSSKYINAKFLQYWPLLSPSHEGIVEFVYNTYLTKERNGTDLLCIVGEPHSGKKSILSNLIQRYTDGLDPLPVFALPCARLTYTEVSVRLAAFLEFLDETSADRGEPVVTAEDKLRRIRAQAELQAAVYIFSDLELLANDPARRLIRQEDVVELINVLLCSNPRTRVIISCEDPSEPGQGGRSVPPFTYVPRSLDWADTMAMLVRLAPPTVQSLLRAVDPLLCAVDRVAEEGALVGLQQFQANLIDGVALGLCTTFLRLCAAKGMFGQGVREVETLLTSAQAEGGKLRPEPVLTRLWDVLTPLQQALCVVIAASDDGVRKSSLCWVLQRLPQCLLPTLDEEWETALKELIRAFDDILRHEDPNQREDRGRPWVLDDLPGEQVEEPLFEFNQLTRRAILTKAEGGSEPERDLVRQAHRLIAARAREQAHHRRLNVPGVYGARLPDLLRDIQALLGLLASVSVDSQDKAQGGLSPLEVERAVLEGRTDGYTTLRFAFLQMWRQDIDRDYRLNTVHAADELRLHVLLAIATSSGKSFFPPQRYQITWSDFKSGFDVLRAVFSADELLELLTSLAISAYQTGAFQIVQKAAAYAEMHLTDKDSGKASGQTILRMKLWRAWIDAQVLVGRDPNPDLKKIINLGEIEKQVRDLITSLSISGNDSAEEKAEKKKACLKLHLRLGEVCYLQGEEPASEGRMKRDEACDAFKEAVSLERELSGEESCTEGRSLISGHGARRFLRAMLKWAMDEAEKGNWPRVKEFIDRAQDLHAISLRRLSRHAADRAGILLDEASLQYVTGYVHQHRHGLDEEAHKAYGRAKDLIAAAHEFAIQPGLPIAVKLDLDSLVAAMGIRLAGVYDEDKDELLRRCDSSVKRLRRIADGFGLTIYMAYSRLLMFRLRKARDCDQAYKDSALVKELRDARELCEESGLGLYKSEIEGYLERCHGLAQPGDSSRRHESEDSTAASAL
jgi:hypothetical protein